MGKYLIRKVPSGIKFDLKATNGEVIATSEVYTTKNACVNGIASVKRNAPIAGVEDQTKPDFETVKHPKFEIYTDKAGEIRFRLKARNGEIIATSEGYRSMSACVNGIESVRKNSDGETVEEEAVKG
ncbi:MAG: YegP family protein [Clostridia bacterium]|nr:YegP family protein [Clostridia bacterium]